MFYNRFVEKKRVIYMYFAVNYSNCRIRLIIECILSVKFCNTFRGKLKPKVKMK